MEIKIQDRQTGKTYDIAQIMKKDRNAICIQPSQVFKRHFMEKYRFSNKRVFTMNEYLESCGLRRKSNVYFDEVGMCLGMMCQRFQHTAIYGVHTDF